jgi:DNA-binding transcriptional ArsR family regulator
LLRHAADPTRLQILLALADEPLNGESLIARLGQTPSAVAHHLALLRHGGLVIAHRQGGVNSYELTPAGRTLAQAVRRLLVPVPNPPRVSIGSRAVTTVDQLAALPDAEWVALNRRRGVLIRRKNRQGLDAEQVREFELLQQASLRRMQRDFPLDDTFEDRLRDLETMLLGAGPIEK